MLKVVIDYPNRGEELTSSTGWAASSRTLEVRPVLSRGRADALRRAVDAIYVDEKVKGYIVDLVQATRKPEEYGLELTGLIQYGASPRATIALVRAARAQAFLDGRGYVTPQDVKSAAAGRAAPSAAGFVRGRGRGTEARRPAEPDSGQTTRPLTQPMQQVLFRIPSSRTFSAPDGLPVNGLRGDAVHHLYGLRLVPRPAGPANGDQSAAASGSRTW